jgi:hypothetical protein
MFWVGIPPTAIARKQVFLLPNKKMEIAWNFKHKACIIALLGCTRVAWSVFRFGEKWLMFIQAKGKLKPIYTSP